jgi:hypothetical protein
VLRVGSFGRETRGEPVELPVHIVIDLGETETFEPPRGPRTEISGRVPAIDDHGSTSIKTLFRVSFYFPEREVDGTRKMVLLELVRRQNLHDLRAFVQEPLNLLTLDLLHLEHPRKMVTSGPETRVPSVARVNVLDEQVVRVAESPILTRLGGSNGRVTARSKMLRRVAIGRGITASDVTAHQTLA